MLRLWSQHGHHGKGITASRSCFKGSAADYKQPDMLCHYQRAALLPLTIISSNFVYFCWQILLLCVFLTVRVWLGSSYTRVPRGPAVNSFSLWELCSKCALASFSAIRNLSKQFERRNKNACTVTWLRSPLTNGLLGPCFRCHSLLKL